MPSRSIHSCVKNIHLHLCGSIISQQLSTKVAEVIYKRFLALFNTQKPGIHQILALPFDTLRSIGLSNAKTNYVHNVCRFFYENKITDAKLHKMSDEEFITFITQIKGIGQWTAEMQLMFTLGREDVFSTGDLGIQQAMTRLYKLNAGNKKPCRSKCFPLLKNGGHTALMPAAIYGIGRITRTFPKRKRKRRSKYRGLQL